MSLRWLTHLRVELALHELRGGEGRPLLVLHGLGERTPPEVPTWIGDAWPGPVVGLDFTGHGLSTVPVGGGYGAEALLGDADAVIAELGEVTVVGRGLGAYIALLLAGARPGEVLGAALMDGPGLMGGGTGPGVSPVAHVPPGPHLPPDPYALVELGRDLRPPDYAELFARQAVELSPLDHPLTVLAGLRPPWLQAVVDTHGVVTATALSEVLGTYASLP